MRIVLTDCTGLLRRLENLGRHRSYANTAEMMPLQDLFLLSYGFGNQSNKPKKSTFSDDTNFIYLLLSCNATDPLYTGFISFSFHFYSQLHTTCKSHFLFLLLSHSGLYTSCMNTFLLLFFLIPRNALTVIQSARFTSSSYCFLAMNFRCRVHIISFNLDLILHTTLLYL